ncbi:MAG: DUF3786 domain-containing protein [bacterium]
MYWERLRKSAPEDISERTLVSYKEDMYRLDILGQTYAIDPGTEKINGTAPDHFFQAFLLQYLLAERPVSPAGSWISGRDIPGGPLFFRGPHEISAARLVKSYGNDPERFVSRGLELGGEPDPVSKYAIKLTVLPLVPVCLLLWPASDEFPAEAGMLFDAASPKFLPKDALWALSCWTIKKFISG